MKKTFNVYYAAEAAKSEDTGSDESASGNLSALTTSESASNLTNSNNSTKRHNS